MARLLKYYLCPVLLYKFHLDGDFLQFRVSLFQMNISGAGTGGQVHLKKPSLEFCNELLNNNSVYFVYSR